MAGAKKGIEGFENAGEDMLRMKVGMVFLRGKEPNNAPGMIRHQAPKDAKWAKFYFPLKGHNLLDGKFEYIVPECMRGALHGELFLTKSPVSFGRFGEDKSFTFDEKKSYIYLRIDPVEKREFTTLYMRASSSGGDPLYFALMIRWAGDVISVSLYPVDEEEVPLVLKAE